MATFFHQDQLGSTRLVTPAAAPVTPVGSYTYDPFGAITISSGTAPAFGYAGQVLDSESGLVYLRARYYDPSTGQFTTRDPAVAQTREPYAYTADNPLNHIDLTGLRVPWDRDTEGAQPFGPFANNLLNPLARPQDPHYHPPGCNLDLSARSCTWYPHPEMSCSGAVQLRTGRLETQQEPSQTYISPVPPNPGWITPSHPQRYSCGQLGEMPLSIPNPYGDERDPSACIERRQESEGF